MSGRNVKYRKLYEGLAFTAALCFVTPIWSQTSVLIDRLHKAEADSSLDQAGLLPWHLKLEVQYYDPKGKPTEKGVIEEWWASPKLSLVSYSLPDYTGTYLRNQEGRFSSQGPGSSSYLADTLLDQIIHPMPQADDYKDATPDLRKQSFGKVSLDCIMLEHPLKGVAYLPLGLYPTYCFDQGKDSLRATYSLGSKAILRNTMGLFQGRSIPLEVTIDEGSYPSASARVLELKGMHVDPAQFMPTPDMEPVPDVNVIPALTMAGKVLKKEPPVYPAAARQRHSEGSVVLHAIIGRDGKIHSLTVISTPDADLALSALAAVQHWVYAPFIVDNRAVVVDTTITVNYKIGT